MLNFFVFNKTINQIAGYGISKNMCKLYIYQIFFDWIMCGPVEWYFTIFKITLASIYHTLSLYVFIFSSIDIINIIITSIFQTIVYLINTLYLRFSRLNSWFWLVSIFLNISIILVFYYSNVFIRPIF